MTATTTGTDSREARSRVRLHVGGLVQGVGFRPFVHRLATELDLGGHVHNDERGVLIEVEGATTSVRAFVDRLRIDAPPLARIDHVEVQPVAPEGETRFTVEPSSSGPARRTLVSPDVAACGACLDEVDDPGDRRHRYALTNCTDCGPRYTIVRDVPYDRPATTMASFPMCATCEREYRDPADRRFHAQPVCCPACGPRLELRRTDGTVVDGDAIDGAVALLRDGAIVAVKGLGGFHLAADAAHPTAAATLRARKHREDKPFAVMAPDLGSARRLVEVDEHEAALLTSPAAPIVLLRRRADATVAGAVAPRNRWLGVMLPYTPLHHLLLAAHGAPLVLTSGNVSHEPIVHRDDQAVERLASLADGLLIHDRPIHVGVDDSVVRLVGGRALPIRRARGYVPEPLELSPPTERQILACGAQLKSTVCVARGRHAFVSQHLGDLDDLETYRLFTATIAHLCRLFDVSPEVVAHDLHPDYVATRHAGDLEGVRLLGVQHHHAHVASCLADNGEPGPVIGVAFDGTGYGTDGTVWGGEVLVADRTASERLGHLDTVPLPGGEAAVREPWRMAAAHLEAAFGDAVPDDLAVARRNAERWGDVLAVARAGVNSPPTSSAGRLFDAVAAILGVRDTVTYEGQAAIELEQRADEHERGSYPVTVTDGPPFRIHGADLVRAVVEDLSRGRPVAAIAARFHHGVADAIATVCERTREATGLGAVALSGGVFQNVLLVERTVPRLEGAGFRVLTHRRVPPNDGGISLGQAVVAAAVSSRSTW